MNKEPKEEGRTSGKREVEGDREIVEITRICLDHVSSKAFDVVCPSSEDKSHWDSWGVLQCVCVRAFWCLLTVPAVVFPF